MPPMSNSSAAILQAWTALEVLAPATFRRPEQLAGGDRRMVARLDGPELPWERGAKSKPDYRLYYHVVLGSIDVGRAVDGLLKVYADDRPERARSSDRAALASVLVDRDGRPVDREAVAVSSFGWGVPVALRGELATLGHGRSTSGG